MTISNNKKLYQKFSKYYNEIANQRNHYDKQIKYLLSLFNYLGITNDSKLFDAACGTGEVGYRLYKQGYLNIELNDVSKEMLSHLNTLDLQHSKTHNYAWEEIDQVFSKSNNFDIIYIIGHSLPHASFENLETIFSNIFKGLKKGGYFVFDMRNWIKDKDNYLIQKGRKINQYRDLGTIEFNDITYRIYDKVNYQKNKQFVQYKIVDNFSNKVIDEFSVSYTIFTIYDIIPILIKVGFSYVDNISKNIEKWSYETICCKKD